MGALPASERWRTSLTFAVLLARIQGISNVRIAGRFSYSPIPFERVNLSERLQSHHSPIEGVSGAWPSQDFNGTAETVFFGDPVTILSLYPR